MFSNRFAFVGVIFPFMIYNLESYNRLDLMIRGEVSGAPYQPPQFTLCCVWNKCVYTFLFHSFND